MFIVLFFLIILSAVGLLMHFKSRLFLGFFLCFAGMFAMTAAAILCSIRLSLYPYFNSIDQVMYTFFYSYPVSLEAASRIYNLGMAVTMLSMTYITCVVSRKWFSLSIISIISVLVFLAINEPLFCERLFYIVNTPSPLEYYYLQLYNAIKTYSYLIFTVHTVAPLVLLAIDHFKSRLYINKKRISRTLMTQFSIAIFLLYQYNFTIHRIYAPWNVDLLKFPTETYWGASSNTIQATLLMIAVFFFLTLAANPFDFFKITTNKGYQKNARNLNHNMRMVLHSDKNILVAIDKLSEQILELKDKYPDIVERNLCDIRSVVDNGINQLSKTIDIINDIPKIDGSTDIIDCIETALRSLPCSDIHIERRFRFDSIYINAHSMHITECFVNLFQNCIDAISTTGREDGVIRIDVDFENPYVWVEITDNGCGIPKDKIKSIFSPFVSTKQSAKNWGIGLNYVQNVMNLYNGNIWVKSAVNSYTTFQITFPIKTKKEISNE